MRVALDLQLTLGTATGIGEYARGLAGALTAEGVDVVGLAEPRLDPWRFDRRVLWDQILLPRAAARSGAELLHCTSGTMPLVPPRGMPVVTTVHDVAWLRVQGHTRAYARAYFGAFSLARYRHARRLVVDSGFSRDELLAVLGPGPKPPIDVVFPGVAADIAAVQRAPSSEPFVLAVGTVEPRKDLATVIRALAGTDVRLVSVGPTTPYAAECDALARRCGTRLEMLGYRPRAELLDLYAHAAVAVVPSRYEGFGYGLAQALCAGVPVLAADATSLPEVARDDAILLPPAETVAWAHALARMLDDLPRATTRAAALRERAIARLGWTSSARRMRSIYEASRAEV